MKQQLLVTIFPIVLLACMTKKQPVVVAIIIPNSIILENDTALHKLNGVYIFHKQPYSGYIQKKFPSGQLAVQQSIYNGLSEGWTKEYYENGQLLSTRYYHVGEKDSTHTGWWINGNLRFIYHFRNGVYDGSFEEFYFSGHPLKKIMYYNGQDSCGQGWRENGKLFMNYTMKNGRRYGLMNAQPCYALKKEKAKFY